MWTGSGAGPGGAAVHDGGGAATRQAVGALARQCRGTAQPRSRLQGSALLAGPQGKPLAVPAGTPPGPPLQGPPGGLCTWTFMRHSCMWTRFRACTHVYLRGTTSPTQGLARGDIPNLEPHFHLLKRARCSPANLVSKMEHHTYAMHRA